MSMKKQFRKLTAICMAAIMSLGGDSESLTAFADQSVDLADQNTENIFEDTAIKATPSDAEKKQKKKYKIATGSDADVSDETKDDRKNESKYDKIDTTDAEKKQEKKYKIATSSDADISDEAKDEQENELEQDKTSAAKIYDFIWQDPEEYLNDGRLELSATAEEQPTLEQIISILPQSILAKTEETAENTSADEAEDITADYDVEIEVSGWQCADYIQNEDGMWPTSGTFTFSAEPEDGYELADGCAPLAVEVAVSDEAAMLATDISQNYILRIVANGSELFWGIDGGELIHQGGDIPAGVTVSLESTNKYKLSLNNANLSQLSINGGTWNVDVAGKNTISNDNMAFIVQNHAQGGKSDISFTGSGSLTVESGAICAFYLTDDTQVSMNGGSYEIRATGTGDIRNGSGALSLNYKAGMTINGATVNVSQTSGRSGIDLYSKNSLTIESGTVTASGGKSLSCSSASTFTISEQGKKLPDTGWLLCEGRRKLGRHGQPERAIREQPKEMTGKSLLVSEK